VKLRALTNDVVGCVQSRSNTPSSRSRSPALDLVVSVGGPAQLAAVSSDVREAFAGAGAGIGAPGPGLGSWSCPRPSSAGVVPASPRLGVSRDLLEATDYITGAVTSLVKELHSGQTVQER